MKCIIVVALALLADGASVQRKPNIIFVLTDDQDVRLGSVQAMPHLRNLMSQGANMSNFFIHTPICCQSRATLLSGKYTHNVKSRSQGAQGCMHMNTSRVENPGFWEGSFIRSLNLDHGYTTGLFGKVLNDMKDYGCDNKNFADGIDRSFIMCTVAFYNAKWTNFTTVNGTREGSVIASGSKPEDYTTSMIGNASLTWIKDVISQGADHKPFFAFLGPHAPHLPSTPPPYAVDPAIAKIPAPKDPMYGVLQKDKHAFFPIEPEISATAAAGIEAEHTKRLQSLVAVDDVLGQLEAYLKSVGEWENTYVFYTSDHGYNLGQFRVDSHKTQVYDHNSRVPMIIKGPGIAEGVELPLVTSMVDLGPTILEIASGSASAVPNTMDGMSFAPALAGQDSMPWKGAALIEYRSIRPKNTASMCQDGPISPEEMDEYISAYGYEVDAELDEDGRPSLCSSPLLSTHWSTSSAFPPAPTSYHDGPNNTFAALRIIDGDDDWLYAEFVDVLNPLAWDFAEEQVNYRELYNVKEDYFMMNNLINSAPDSLKKTLSQRLQSAVRCQGHADCFQYLGKKSGETLVTV